MSSLKRILLTCHFDGSQGNLPTLKKFLSQSNDVYTILHPLETYKLLGTTYEDNGVIKHKKRKDIVVMKYLIDILLSLRYAISVKPAVLIGCSNVDTLPLIVYKIFRREIIVIYYPRDYSPSRFDSKVLNTIYKIIERIVLRYSDYTISNTLRSENARIELGLNTKKSIYIPNPVDIKNPTFKYKKILSTKFIYVGDVSNEHGLIDIIEYLPNNANLTVIGKVKDLKLIQTICNKNRIKLNLFGEMDHDKVIRYLSNFRGWGLAPYNRNKEWTYYCSPLKVSEYISTGVPVLMSNVPEISNYIKKNKLGIIYSQEKINKSDFDLSDFDLSHYHLKAERFYSMHNTSKILHKLNDLLKI